MGKPKPSQLNFLAYPKLVLPKICTTCGTHLSVGLVLFLFSLLLSSSNPTFGASPLRLPASPPRPPPRLSFPAARALAEAGWAVCRCRAESRTRMQAISMSAAKSARRLPAVVGGGSGNARRRQIGPRRRRNLSMEAKRRRPSLARFWPTAEPEA
jgi:hypothetical protein